VNTDIDGFLGLFTFCIESKELILMPSASPYLVPWFILLPTSRMSFKNYLKLVLVYIILLDFAIMSINYLISKALD
jgi:hypothetical protein